MAKSIEKQLIPVGRVFYGIAVAVTGALHFIYPGIRPVLAPLPPASTEPYTVIIYLNALIIVAAGIAIATGKFVKSASLVLGTLFQLFFVFAHIPNRIINYINELGAWTDAVKLLALAGGAFVIASLYPANSNNGFVRLLEKIAPYGKYFYAVMLIVFGIDHFIYVDFVSSLVPGWIPGKVFWTYFCGVCLFGSGVAIYINFKPHVISLLLAAMLFIWLVTIHIPFSIRFSHKDSGINLSSACQDLAYCGIALLYPFVKRWNGQRLPKPGRTAPEASFT